ncbi:hypothetical protein HUJ05_004359 [Dendroctonus ponderosae]|nr:hypothetical protein HUJ05_004359 [Dendroctonus ponderosae]
MSLRQILIRYSPDVSRLLSMIGSAERLYRENEDFPVSSCRFVECNCLWLLYIWKIAEKEGKFSKRHIYGLYGNTFLLRGVFYSKCYGNIKGNIQKIALSSLTSMFIRNQRAFVARTCKLAGLYPVQLLPEDENLRKLYTIYYQALIMLYFICLISFCTELFHLLRAEKATVDDILKSISMTTLFAMTALRQWVIRSSPDVQKILRKAGNVEQRVYEENDPEVVNIFERAGHVALLYYIYYAVGTVFLCLGCILEPLYDNQKVFSGNATAFSRKLPLPLWFPYDIQAHYWAMAVDVLFFYFIRSPVIQLEILHHFFKRFNDYTGRISVEPGNVASNVMMRKCIDMHRKVIKLSHLQ